MKREEITVQAKLKPNCGLENTRASLVMRRIAPLCDSATCHPHAIKSSRETIPYLRDHGLFVTFVSRTPERVLAAISGAFFVDSCTIVEDPEGIPPFEMPSAPQEDDAENGGIEAISSFADRDARSERDEKLSNLIAQLEETNRSLRAHAESLPNDRVLSDIAFSYAQTLDHLRSTVALSRIEAFDRIAPSLHKLVEDYGRQFGVPVDLELEQGRMDLDRSVLASIEETLRRALRSCIRDGIESAEERADLGKPERATIRLRLENEGSDVVCRIEHDGRPFDAHRIATIASKRGLLARPLDAYSDEEIGAFILLPQFFLPSAASDGNAFAELNEIGCMLQRIGGRGTMRNTAARWRSSYAFPCRSPCSKPPCCAPEASASQFPHSRSCASRRSTPPASSAAAQREKGRKQPQPGTRTNTARILRCSTKVPSPFRLTRRTPHIPSCLKLWGNDTLWPQTTLRATSGSRCCSFRHCSTAGACTN